MPPTPYEDGFANLGRKHFKKRNVAKEVTKKNVEHAYNQVDSDGEPCILSLKTYENGQNFDATDGPKMKRYNSQISSPKAIKSIRMFQNLQT